MKLGNMPAATLLVSSWSSQCNNCGQDCNPDELDHQAVLGWNPSPDAKGCGITFTHITSMYTGELHERLTKQMRPDLEYIPLEW